jgi:hypothetical protein
MGPQAFPASGEGISGTDMIVSPSAQPEQSHVLPVSPERCAWIGGHGTEP